MQRVFNQTRLGGKRLNTVSGWYDGNLRGGSGPQKHNRSCEPAVSSQRQRNLHKVSRVLQCSANFCFSLLTTKCLYEDWLAKTFIWMLIKGLESSPGKLSVLVLWLRGALQGTLPYKQVFNSNQEALKPHSRLNPWVFLNRERHSARVQVLLYEKLEQFQTMALQEQFTTVYFSGANICEESLELFLGLWSFIAV